MRMILPAIVILCLLAGCAPTPPSADAIFATVSTSPIDSRMHAMNTLVHLLRCLHLLNLLVVGL
ncbi:MAG: hypothetical protein N2556_09685, partial [Anaerolineae bacterium]|nr:hypothetical protein [Anaerolineae bacterium]